MLMSYEIKALEDIQLPAEYQSMFLERETLEKDGIYRVDVPHKPVDKERKVQRFLREFEGKVIGKIKNVLGVRPGEL